MIVRYFKCPICGKTTPLDSLVIPDEEGLFTIQEREAAGRGGFPAIAEYDVLDSDDDDEELILLFADRIQYLYEKLVELGYLSQEEEQPQTYKEEDSEPSSTELKEMEPEEVLRRAKPQGIVEREILVGLRLSLAMGHEEKAEEWKRDLYRHRAYEELMRELKQR